MAQQRSVVLVWDPGQLLAPHDGQGPCAEPADEHVSHEFRKDRRSEWGRSDKVAANPKGSEQGAAPRGEGDAHGRRQHGKTQLYHADKQGGRRVGSPAGISPLSHGVGLYVVSACLCGVSEIYLWKAGQKAHGPDQLAPGRTAFFSEIL